MRLVAALACLGFGTCCGAADATAQSAPRTSVALSWVRGPGADGCAGAAEVTARVGARLKGSPFVAPPGAQVLIEASIAGEREQHQFRVHILLTSATGESLGTRELAVAGDDCRDATDTAVLAIALMIDPNADSADSAAAFPIEPFTPNAPSLPLAASAAPPPACPPASPPLNLAQPPTHWRARLALGALASLGQLPGAAFGALGSVRLSPGKGRVGVDVVARYLAEQNAEIRSGVGGRFSASSVGLGAFWSPVHQAGYALAVVAGAEAGRVAANGYHFLVSNQYREAWFLNAELGGEVSVKVAESFALLVRLGLKLPLVRPEFQAFADARPVRIFNTSAVIGDVSLGLAFDP